MLEHYFKYPRVLRRLRGGGLGDELDRIAAYLFENGYQRAAAKVYLSRLALFSSFVSGTARGRPVTRAEIESFVGERETDASRITARTAIALARRVMPERFDPLQSAPDPHARLLAAYTDYLHQVRGLEEKTREGEILAARRMLAWWDANHGGPLSTMTGAHILTLVEHLMARTANDRTRATVGSHTRQFLKFLRWADFSDHDLARFVPRTPCYRLAHLPPRLAWEDVRRAIDAIDVITPTGVRDRAIVLLFATTGIRSKELRSLVLEDIRVGPRDGAIAPSRSCKRQARHSPTTSFTLAPSAIVDVFSCSICRRCVPWIRAESFRASSALRCYERALRWKVARRARISFDTAWRPSLSASDDRLTRSPICWDIAASIRPPSM